MLSEDYQVLCALWKLWWYKQGEGYCAVRKVKIIFFWAMWRLLCYGNVESYGLWQGEGHCIMEGWLLLCYGQGEGYCIILKKWRIYCVMGRVKANVLWSKLRLCYGQGENSMTFYKSFILFYFECMIFVDFSARNKRCYWIISRIL